MEYSVQAKDNSLTNGVGKDAGTYSRNSLLVITCDPEDTWQLADDKLLPSNADGLDNLSHDKDGMVINVGTMVGSIDGGASFFPVGTLCQLSITTDNTQLKLYCWDSNNYDNSGAISAYIQCH